MTKKTKKYCEAIAKLHGAKLTWIEGDWGFYLPGTNRIHVGGTGPDKVVISIFCHELGHYQNFLNEKYPRYHNGTNWPRKFKSKRGAARYALRAELYTEKVGRRLCKQYFPEVKYQQNYQDSERWFNFMYLKLWGKLPKGVVMTKWLLGNKIWMNKVKVKNYIK